MPPVSDRQIFFEAETLLVDFNILHNRCLRAVLDSLMPDMNNQCHDPDNDDRRDMSRTLDYFDSCCLLGGVAKLFVELIGSSPIRLPVITFLARIYFFGASN